ncbi:hypothetical protein HNR30_001840 [Nonomuraea soli]|uniref:Uncharacterized protein n=2 Tax=Nonomuraea soli TaxID=1032476 RepID=A0A7W0HP57_9ACTN|nr:hypothetical protein [Nonomuraea soli]
MSQLARRIAAVCREMERDDLREIVAERDAGALLDRILAALAPGGDTTTLERDLDDLDAHLVAYGIPGGLVPPRWRAYRPSPVAADGPRPKITVWACPTASCARWLPVAGAVPRCSVRDVPLVEKEISA